MYTNFGIYLFTLVTLEQGLFFGQIPSTWLGAVPVLQIGFGVGGGSILLLHSDPYGEIIP